MAPWFLDALRFAYLERARMRPELVLRHSHHAYRKQYDIPLAEARERVRKQPRTLSYRMA